MRWPHPYDSECFDKRSRINPRWRSQSFSGRWTSVPSWSFSHQVSPHHTVGSKRSLAKTPIRMAPRPEAIFSRALATLLSHWWTWFSLKPSNLSSMKCTSLKYAAILGSQHFESFITCQQLVECRPKCLGVGFLAQWDA
jgi:hypothetical protein